MNRNVLLLVQFFMLTFLRLVVIILGLHLGQQLKLFNGAVKKKNTCAHTEQIASVTCKCTSNTHTKTSPTLETGL